MALAVQWIILTISNVYVLGAAHPNTRVYVRVMDALMPASVGCKKKHAKEKSI